MLSKVTDISLDIKEARSFNEQEIKEKEEKAEKNYLFPFEEINYDWKLEKLCDNLISICEWGRS